MRYSFIACLLCSACSHAPTAPTPVATPVPVTVVPTPAPAPAPAPAPTRNPLLDDPRFDLAFYRLFVLGADRYGAPGQYRLNRQAQAPRIYLRTVHAITGKPLDADTLTKTAAALIDTTGKLTGVFGLAGLERGTEARPLQAGWINVTFTNDPEAAHCGRGQVGGRWLELYTNTPRCRCDGGPAVMLSTVKHELGHVLGYYHTERGELMYFQATGCDSEPSAREIFHARVAYSQAIGSTDPK